MSTTEGNNTALRFENVTKRYKNEPLFDGFCLGVLERQILSIIGPSGSGKSTLLRLVMGLERLDGGEIIINGGNKIDAATKELPLEVKKGIGMVFQHYNLFPHLSVLENIALAPMKVLKLQREEAESEARRLLDSVGLLDKESHYPRELSGGQRQRVAIARALAMHPKILLLDEITSALDPELTFEVLDVIRKIALKKELTIVIVTHEMAFAKEISDRICFLDGGVILESGAPHEIFESPKHPRLQAFLGSMRL